MAPHLVNILRRGLSVVLDFPANTVSNRNWVRWLITQADVAHKQNGSDRYTSALERKGDIAERGLSFGF